MFDGIFTKHGLIRMVLLKTPVRPLDRYRLEDAMDVVPAVPPSPLPEPHPHPTPSAGLNRWILPVFPGGFRRHDEKLS